MGSIDEKTKEVFTRYQDSVRVLFYFLATALGVFVAMLNLQASKSVIIAILLAIFALLLGFVQPTNAWRWGLVLGIWLPLEKLVLMTTNPTIYPTDILKELLMVIPPIIGAYIGAFMKRNLNLDVPESIKKKR